MVLLVTPLITNWLLSGHYYAWSLGTSTHEVQPPSSTPMEPDGIRGLPAMRSPPTM